MQKHQKKTLLKSSLLLSLFNVSLVGTGFSSWVLTEVKNATIEAELKVAKIETQNIFSNLESNTFKLSKSGIVEDETIVNKGYINVNFSIDNKKAFKGNYVNSSNSLIIVATISSNSKDFINLVDNPSTTSDNVTININSSDDEKAIKNVVTLKNLESTGVTDITLSYDVNGDLASYYNLDLDLSFTVEALSNL